MFKTGAKERIRSERQEASQQSPFSALPKATPSDFCLHLFDQVGGHMASLISTWDQTILHFSRALCYPQTKLGCYRKNEKEKQILGRQLEILAAIPERKGGRSIFRKEQKSLGVLDQNEQGEKNCLCCWFPSGVSQRNKNCSPLHVKQLSDILSVLTQQGPWPLSSTVLFLAMDQETDLIGKRLQDWFPLLKINV